MRPRFSYGGEAKSNRERLPGTPKVEFNGEEEVATDTSMIMTMVGAGFTYYFGPSNVYLTASVGASTLSFEFEGDSEDSDTGVAFDVGLGKEWWVGDRWGLGVSATVGYHSVPPGDAGSNFKSPSFNWHGSFSRTWPGGPCRRSEAERRRPAVRDLRQRRGHDHRLPALVRLDDLPRLVETLTRACP